MGMELDGGMMHILTGLKEGQQIVAAPSFLMDSESRLRAVNRRFGPAPDWMKLMPQMEMPGMEMPMPGMKMPAMKPKESMPSMKHKKPMPGMDHKPPMPEMEHKHAMPGMEGEQQ